MTNGRPGRRGLLAILAATVLISAPLALGFLGALHAAFDSFAHFRAHLAVAMVLLALPLVLTGLRFEALGAVVLGLGALYTLAGELPFGGPPAVGSANGERAVYSLLQINLLHDNADPGQVLSLIARERPDIVTLNEVEATWRQRLDLLAMAYPHRVYCEPAGHFAVAILSTRPFANAPYCQPEGWFALARVDLAGREVAVGAVHLDWPWPFRQPAQAEALATMLPPGETMILAGDFNAVPWSRTVARVEQGGLFARARGIGPTWLLKNLPAGLIPWIGLPLDHILWRGRIEAVSVDRLEPVGSDHLPLRMRFSVPPPAEPDVDRLQASIPGPFTHRGEIPLRRPLPIASDG